MRSSTTLSSAFTASLLLLTNLASACNPITDGTCPPDKALGTTVNIDFTAGPSSEFTASYNTISYESDGIHLSVTKQGDAPLLVSNWYIMFGRFEIVFQSAPGVGMVSSAILQSDDLDEIDWELLGADPTEAQTNYFGRGVTETYDREVTVADASATTGFNTYVIDWNQDRIIWSINGVTLRTQYAANADVDSSGKSEYPQTPMQVKIGPWAGGDPNNSPGTISWAGGQINYGAGPYTMIVKSVSVTDYSTGSEYEYNSGFSGSWQDITAVGGAVLGNADGTAPASSAPVESRTAATTSTPATVASSSTLAMTSSASSVAPIYTPSTTSSSIVDTHTGWPWVATTTGTGSSAPAYTSTTSSMTYGSGSSSILPSSSQPSSSFPQLSSSSSASFSAPVPSTYTTSTSVESRVTAVTSTVFVGTSAASTISPTAATSSVLAESQVASSTTSASTAAYTGAAARVGAAHFGAAACVAAGLAMMI